MGNHSISGDAQNVAATKRSKVYNTWGYILFLTVQFVPIPSKLHITQLFPEIISYLAFFRGLYVQLILVIYTDTTLESLIVTLLLL